MNLTSSAQRLTPSRALAELMEQHDALRELMDHCEDLADSMDSRPEADPGPLTRELARVRIAFDAHNKYEEQLLRSVLQARDKFGNVNVDRMVNDHAHEHRAIGAKLKSPSTAALRDVVETLRAHLDAEERYLLSSPVIREDA